MSVIPVHRREACARKKAYLTYTHARADAKALARKSGEVLNVYRCVVCRNWHVGRVHE